MVSLLAERGYTVPTPIQAQAIPEILAGRDLLGLAATGTGKTAAFVLPILHRLHLARSQGEATPGPALVLSPTRELAAQTAATFRLFGRLNNPRAALVVGGVAWRPQVDALARKPDIIVATPGRLIDHVEQGTAKLGAVSLLVVDEIDHMLEVGFLPAVMRIVGLLPTDRQSLFFSATMPSKIEALSRKMQRNPKTVSVSQPATPVARIDQSVVLVEPGAKLGLLKAILDEGKHGRSLVFTRTKRGADKVAGHLLQTGLEAVAIHGDRSQKQRNQALSEFREGRTAILVATDVAARGVHVDGIDLVVNFDMPDVPETYVHRIGRTARAGAAGVAISFCGRAERSNLGAIEALIRHKLPTSGSHAMAASAAPASAETRSAAAQYRRRQPPRHRPEEGADPGLSRLPMFRPTARKRNSTAPKE
ncbi:MAG: DEAD/DEAH box helicase [Azospirillum sp.]|nr:DEAD/DEAH box helicase [Azospirillum sp.]